MAHPCQVGPKLHIEEKTTAEKGEGVTEKERRRKGARKGERGAEVGECQTGGEAERLVRWWESR